MEKSQNYNLNKPAATDFFGVESYNQNVDIVDGALQAIQASASAAMPKSGGYFSGTAGAYGANQTGFILRNNGIYSNASLLVSRQSTYDVEE